MEERDHILNQQELIKANIAGLISLEKGTYFSPEERKRLAKEGKAMPNGSFPIRNEKDLKDAIKLAAMAKNVAAAKAFIIKRSKEMGLEKLIPDTWGEMEKGKKVPIGTISGGRKKVADGKWVTVGGSEKKKDYLSGKKVARKVEDQAVAVLKDKKASSKEIDSMISKVEKRIKTIDNSVGGRKLFDEKYRLEDMHKRLKIKAMKNRQGGHVYGFEKAQEVGSEIISRITARINNIANSFVSNDIEKGKKEVIGTVKEWKGQKMKKVAEGKWEPVKESKKKEGDEKEEALKHNKARASKIMKILFGPDFEFDFSYKPEGDRIVIHPEGYNPDGTLFDMKDSHKEKIIKKFREKLPKAHATPNMGGGITVNLNSSSLEKKPVDMKVVESYIKSTTNSLQKQIDEISNYHNISRKEALEVLAEAESNIRKKEKIDPANQSKKELYEAVNKKYGTNFKPGSIEEFEDDEFRVQLDEGDIKNIVEAEKGKLETF